ncbi:MAG: lipoyl synthase [SAR86 cluster bacterium]|nr:lipoyl synthase [SAR86 cluster bacterium]|tara:strand:+ start:1823 stop:2782 length:960 start_codon:yes stop_codon:yes gene_type:complete
MNQVIPIKTIKDNGTIAIRNGIKPNKNKDILPTRKPDWLRLNHSFTPKFKEVKSIVKENHLNTVCEEAMCPNINECWSHGTATFMLLGDVCTRACKFCAVDTGNPRGRLDKKEPYKVAQSIKKMSLKYAVLTSVNRDDLADGGAKHYSNTIEAIKYACPKVMVEALTPDFEGKNKSISILLSSSLDVFAQNVETVERLTARVRDPRAGYQQTLNVLEKAKKLNPEVLTKTSLMLGLGETTKEIQSTMVDACSVGVEILTLGQYLRPTLNHLPVERYIPPEEFLHYKNMAKEIGFKEVASGPMVRSSYRADKVARLLQDN